ncbi:hypothetical protein ILUMI_26483 [Ignelater luminosus]|uniref:Sister chromatid cohesion protein DCC1 n=1 Tax=Ignelater luminosus TaxID=2038154 RepID=A0A8K0C6F0_IGNLU|nr:hypothetical protein ILUMI_26483 [Ignelater luminosus]
MSEMEVEIPAYSDYFIKEEMERSLKDIDDILNLAKLNPNNLFPTSQIVYFTSKNLHNNNYRLLQLDNHLLETLNKGDSIRIKGTENENAVLCTDTRTYDILETETSNSLLLVQGLRFKDSLKANSERSISKVTASGIFYDYLEVKVSKPRLHRLYEILNKTLYKGPEYEKDVNDDDLFTYSDLLNNIQASKKELNDALASMHIVKMNDKIRLLDLEYHFRILSYMLRLIDDNSWGLDEIDYETTINSLNELAPFEVLNSLFDLYTEESKIVDSLQLYRYKERDVCRFFAQILLSHAGKFNFSEFLQAWSESVPEGMKPEIEMLNGLAIIDKTTIPHVIRAFPEENLPENIMDRFKVLFDVKEKWTVPEIAPYIQQLTTDKADVNTLLAKYARASTVNGVKYYSAKHAK